MRHLKYVKPIEIESWIWTESICQGLKGRENGELFNRYRDSVLWGGKCSRGLGCTIMWI